MTNFTRSYLKKLASQTLIFPSPLWYKDMNFLHLMPDDSFKKLPKFREINFVKKKSRFINQSADLVEFFCMSRDAKVAQKMY